MTREEAIEVYNGLINTKIKEAFEFFAPELAESEDERIRKGLIELIENWNYPQELFTTKRNIIGYLEKQKEPIDPFDTKLFQDGVKEGRRLEREDIKKEQKPAEWSEEDEKIRRNLMSLLANMRGDRITEETYQKYYPWLKDLHPSWKPREEQMQYLRAVINDPNNAGAESCHLVLESLYNGLKKL